MQQISHWCSFSSYIIYYVELSRNVMEKLQGRYLIKLEVDWVYDQVINQGNLVAYGSEGNIRLQELSRSTYHGV